MAETNVQFEKLSKLEKPSKLFQLAQKKNTLILWKKGEKIRTKFEVVDFSREKMELYIKARPEVELINHNILYSFDLNGINFFGKGKVIETPLNHLAIECSGDIYKSERRINYRLLTDPILKVFAFFKVDEEYIGQNIVDFRTKQSQTGIFKEFLKIVGSNKDSLEKEGYLHFRVKNLSVTGLALEVGELEKKFFVAGEKTGKMYLNFEGEEIMIPNAKIVYVLDMIGQKEKGRIYKIGIQFLSEGQGLDYKLGYLINKALRDVKDEFEDFIK